MHTHLHTYARCIYTPVLKLSDKKVLEQRLVLASETAIREDGAEAIVLGCTGMLGLAGSVGKRLSEKGLAVPVVNPTASAIGYLELLIRSGLTHSLSSYPRPLEKERRF
jgi:allantoin racemase